MKLRVRLHIPSRTLLYTVIDQMYSLSAGASFSYILQDTSHEPVTLSPFIFNRSKRRPISLSPHHTLSHLSFPSLSSHPQIRGFILLLIFIHPPDSLLIATRFSAISAPAPPAIYMANLNPPSAKSLSYQAFRRYLVAWKTTLMARQMRVISGRGGDETCGVKRVRVRW